MRSVIVYKSLSATPGPPTTSSDWSKHMDERFSSVTYLRELRRAKQSELSPFSDDALALVFAERHAGELRYIDKWSRWMCWDGTRWQADDRLAVFDRARVICREAAASCNKNKANKLKKELVSAKTVAAVERLARTDRRLAAMVEQWDAHPWLLNTPNGVIDLRTGAMREH